ncbi:flagellar FliL protein [Allopseudospirillum japonicum]|uniref:Flagellar protein FliL n=1 Tax=Allopseudospirillum japonicum TaxID=64971 RepID=A0A1H6QQD1_9GAMM|nr:flagellar basal body-associated FliL family protein [Allopseudospirillum japonicum]SEI45881.1 flagellar FliL protein [Allopseudospirillum japonicum]
MADDELGEKKSNKKTLIIVVVIVLLVAAASAAATLFFLDKVPVDDLLPQESAAAAQGPQIVPSASVYYSFEKPFVTPFAAASGSARQRFMQVRLAVKAQSDDALEAVKRHLPRVLNDLNMLFSSQEFKTLQTPQGKEELRQAATQVVQNVVQQEQVSIDEVLFTDFVMQ